MAPAQLYRLQPKLGESIQAASDFGSLDAAVLAVVTNAFESRARNISVGVDLTTCSFQVLDDGCGISGIDLTERFARCVATSKESHGICQNHGRSMAKLARICRMMVVSRIAGNPDAQMCMENGSRVMRMDDTAIDPSGIQQPTKIPTESGTLVQVTKLFRQVPVRMYQMQSRNAQSRAQAVMKMLLPLVVAYPCTRLSLHIFHDLADEYGDSANSKTLCDVQYEPVQYNCGAMSAFSWLSRESGTHEALKEFQTGYGQFRVSAVLCAPQSFCSSTMLQLVLVNNKVVRSDKRLHRLVRKAYKALIASALKGELFDAEKNRKREHMHPIYAIQFIGPPHVECNEILGDVHFNDCKNCIADLFHQLGREVGLDNINHVFHDMDLKQRGDNVSQSTWMEQEGSHGDPSVFRIGTKRVRGSGFNVGSTKRRCTTTPPNPLLASIETTMTNSSYLHPSVDQIKHKFSTVGTLGGVNAFDSEASYNTAMNACDCDNVVDSPRRVQTSQEGIRVSKETLKSLRFVAQVDRKYLIAANQGLLVAFDQHAVHERIRLEAFERGLLSRSRTIFPGEKHPVYSTQRLSPFIPLDLGSDEVACCQRFHHQLQQWGFEFSQSSNGVILQQVPVVLGEQFGASDFRECINYIAQVLGGSNSSIPWTFKRLLDRKACRGAIMFGDELTTPECRKILRALSRCNFPFQCAHGRPSLVVLMHTSTSKPLSLSGITQKVMQGTFFQAC